MKSMKGINRSLNSYLHELDPTGAQAKARRAAQVQDRWKQAVCKVYGAEAAAFVLSHINAVYIMKQDDPSKKETQLIIYSDDSMVRSDIDSRQEYLKFLLNHQGEHVGPVKILASRFDMKNRHPFEGTDLQANAFSEPVDLSKIILTEEQQDAVESAAEQIDGTAVSTAFKKAMTANLKIQNKKQG